MAQAHTGDVITSLVRRRLRQSRYHPALKETLQRLTVRCDLEQSTIVESLRQLERDYEYREKQLLNEAAYVNNPEVVTDDEEAQQKLLSILDQTQDGLISWGRIAVVLSIVSIIAEMSLKKHNIRRVLKLVVWAEDYFKKKLFDAWICRTGGWGAIVEYTKNKVCGQRAASPAKPMSLSSPCLTPPSPGRSGRHQNRSRSPSRRTSRNRSARSPPREQKLKTQLESFMDTVDESPSASTPFSGYARHPLMDCDKKEPNLPLLPEVPRSRKSNPLGTPVATSSPYQHQRDMSSSSPTNLGSAQSSGTSARLPSPERPSTSKNLSRNLFGTSAMPPRSNINVPYRPKSASSKPMDISAGIKQPKRTKMDMEMEVEADSPPMYAESPPLQRKSVNKPSSYPMEMDVSEEPGESGERRRATATRKGGWV